MSDPARELRRIGREILGPAFVLFVRGVEARARALKLERLYFLAREGSLFQQLYEREGGTLPTTYLYVSRLSTALPAVHELGKRELRIARARPGDRGAAALLDALGLPPTFGVGYLDEADFVADPRMRVRVAALAAEARGHLRAYLEREAWFDTARVGLVDIGWSGTIQDSLMRAFHPEGPDVHGLYFALRDPSDTQADPAQLASKEGVFVDYRRHRALPERAVFHFFELFEQAARALHGTTLGYDDGGKPILKVHGSDRDAESGSETLVRALQAGVLEAVEHPEPWRGIDRLVFSPTRAELDALSRIAHTDDWGADSHLMLGAASASFLQPHTLWKRFHSSHWKPSLLTRLDVPFLPALYRWYVKVRRP
ncbi:MAG: hypothetical protein ABI321_02590 [Polyangia bacterium]